MAIKSGNNKIVNTGSVISFSDSSVTIDIGTQEPKLKLTLIFKNDQEKKTPEMSAEVKGGNKELQLTLYNFNNSLGQGNTNPINIGKLDGHNMFLNFVVYALGGTPSKLLHYTIYQEDIQQ